MALRPSLFRGRRRTWKAVALASPISGHYQEAISGKLWLGSRSFPTGRSSTVSPAFFFLFPQTESLIKSITTNFEALMDFGVMKATWIIQIADSITD